MIFFTSEVEELIGYTFKDKLLIRRAFTHRSYANEYKLVSYENLEYLGDAILDFIVADYLFKNFKSLDEGDMTRIRAEYVCADTLSSISVALGFDKYILESACELKNVNNRTKKYCDIYESVIAALYLDGGLDSSRAFVERTLLNKKRISKKNDEDYKTALQEYVQQYKLGEIKYRVISREGPDHAPIFVVALELNGEKIGSGKGGSKKAAEQEAAKRGLISIKKKGKERA